MERYGILLTALDSGKEAGLISIANNGLMGFRCGDIPWDDSIYDEVLEFVLEKVLFGQRFYNWHNKDMLDPLSETTLRRMVFVLAQMLNNIRFEIRGVVVKAQAITLSKDLSNGAFLFYEPKYKHDIRWANYFRASTLFGHMRFKTTFNNYKDLFSIPEDMIDVVSYEEFAEIDPDRIPLFFACHSSPSPGFSQIPNFFNGDKYAAILTKTLSGCINGVSLYFIPKDIQREENSSTLGFIKLSHY